jgi:mono/diheme cytochrome c family protein
MTRIFPLIFLLAAAPALAQPFSLEDLSGGELFARFCASCHGESGRGDGPVAATLNALVPDLTRIAERHGSFATDDVRQTIDGRSLVVAHGTRFMPVWGYEFWVEEGADITAESAARELIDRIVEYLRTIQAD